MSSSLTVIPDSSSSENKEAANKKFQEVVFAYATLSEDQRRKRYEDDDLEQYAALEALAKRSDEEIAILKSYAQIFSTYKKYDKRDGSMEVDADGSF